jgi:hypothetical protein
MEDLRARVFRGVKLKDHPLGIGDSRIGRRVQEPDIFVRKPKVYSTDVIFELFDLPSSDDHATDSRPSQHPRKCHTGWAYVIPASHLLQRLHDAVAQLFVERNERTLSIAITSSAPKSAVF